MVGSMKNKKEKQEKYNSDSAWKQQKLRDHKVYLKKIAHLKVFMGTECADEII